MAFLAERLKRIKPSPTLAVVAKTKELQAAGMDIISLGAGEPDYDTPDYIKDGAIAAIRRGETKYTAPSGTPELRRAICGKFQHENGLTFKPDDVIVSTGGKQVIYNALVCTVDADDEVIIPAPYWVSYPDMVALCGGTPVIVACQEAQNFKITPEQLEKAITPKTKWLILNSPSNPTGAVYTMEELKALAEVVRRHSNVHVMSDDIYEHLIYDGHKFTTFAQAAPDLAERTLTINGMSKAHSMTGWRMGYGAGPSALIKAMGMVQSQSTSNPSSISQAAALTALQGDQSFLNEWRVDYQRRRDSVVKWVNAITGLSCRVPEGAFYVYVNCAKLLGRQTPGGKTLQKDDDVAQYLLEDALVSVMQGSAFGLSPFFRISYATSRENLDKAGDRIRAACAALRGNSR